jgi:predicted RNase H-like HicB family nuclease
MDQKFTTILESASEGEYFSYCLEVPGANGQGETVEECCQSLADAIQLIQSEVLQDLSEDALT